MLNKLNIKMPESFVFGRFAFVVLLALANQLRRVGVDAVCAPDAVNGTLSVLPGENCVWTASLAATSVEILGSASFSSGELSLSCTSLIVRAGGNIALQLRNMLNVSGDAVLEAGSVINGNARGYPMFSGPGAGSGSFADIGPGGSHAGCGGQGCIPNMYEVANRANAAYGNFVAPVAPGSGGGKSASDPGGEGGAAFRLHVGGTLSLNGSIYVRGQDYGTHGHGGGSGGSIYITCGTLAPSSGSLDASGAGVSSGLWRGSGGSAGRIALVCEKHSFRGGARADVTLQLTAAGGNSKEMGLDGAPGTIWLALGVQAATGIPAAPILLVRGRDRSVAAQPALVLWSGAQPLMSLGSAQIVLELGATLLFACDASVPAGQTANVSLQALRLGGDGSGTLLVGSRVSLGVTDAPPAGAELSLQNASLQLLGGSSAQLPNASRIIGGKLSVESAQLSAGSLAISERSTLSLDRGAVLKCESLLLQSGSRIIVTMTATINVTGNAMLEQGSVIDGMGRGYGPFSGPGAWLGAASHASCGVAGCMPSLSAAAGSAAANAAYGDYAAPVAPGSGGGSSRDPGGAGGAAVRLHVGGALALNASIDVRGVQPIGSSLLKGGSGGSIFVTCGTLAPSNGSLDASGCGAPLRQYCGSGGRVAIVSQRHSFRSASLADVTLQLSATGGTIYLKSDASVAQGAVHRIRLLLVRGPVAQPVIIIGGGDAVVDEIRLENGAALMIAPPELQTGNFSLTAAALTSIGGAGTTSLSVAPNATLLLWRQQLFANGTTGALDPSGVRVANGAQRVIAIRNASTSLLGAQVLLTDRWCSSPDACSSGVASVRFWGADLFLFCRSGSLLHAWTTARLLAITTCSDSEIVAQYDLSGDPGPWLYYEALAALSVPLATGQERAFTNTVPVKLAAPPPSVAGPSNARWRGAPLQLNASHIAALLRSPGVRVLAGVDGSDIRLPLVLLPSSELAAGRGDGNHSALLSLRFVSSAWPTSGTVLPLWLVRVALQVERQADCEDAGVARELILLPAVSVPVVAPLLSQLPLHLPRDGSQLPADSVILPAPPLSAAEAGSVCDAARCAVAVGPFVAIQLACPSGNVSLPQLALPAGYGTNYAVTLILCGGLLNVSLGMASFAPGGVLAVWPPATALFPASESPFVAVHVLLGAADDVASYTGVRVGSVACTGLQVVQNWQPPPGAAAVFASAAARAAAVLVCEAPTELLSAAISAASSDASAAAMPVTFSWADGSSLAAGHNITIVARPRLLAVSPAVLNPGGVAVIDGLHFCKGDPLGACFAGSGRPPVQLWLGPALGVTAPSPGSSSGTVLPAQCTRMSVLSDIIATCTLPALSPSLPGYPKFSAQLVSWSGTEAADRLNVSYPAAIAFVRGVAGVSLPDRFVPSDVSAPWFIPEDSTSEIAVEVVKLSGGERLNGPLECSLAARTAGVLLLPEQEGRPLAGVTGDGRVSFGRVAVQAPFSLQAVQLVVSCTSAQVTDGSGITPQEWTLKPHQLRVTLCDVVKASVASLMPLPLFRAALTLWDGTSNTYMGSPGSELSLADGGLRVPECVPGRVFSAFRLPDVLCEVSATPIGSNTSEPLLQGNSVRVSRASGVASFSALSIGGPAGAAYMLFVRCAVGSVRIPQEPNATIVITGCASGSAPVGAGTGVVSAVCAPCGSGRWSNGGSEPCRGCPPRGASCEEGILRLLSGFYRPPHRAAEPLDEKAALYECLAPERCLVTMHVLAGESGNNVSTVLSANAPASFTCAPGASGPLCAVCEPGYSSSNERSACEVCPAAPLSKGVVAAVIILAVVIIAYLVLRSKGNEAEQRAAAAESIALRILLTHVQALSALRAFRASGLSVFRGMTAWADALSPALLTEGPSSCILQPSFASTFFGTLAAPLIASGVGLLIVLLAAVLCNCSSSEGSGGRAGRGKVLSCSLSPFDCRSIRSRLLAAWRSREAERVLVIILSLTYMSVVSACISALDCSEPVDGIRYLRTDYRVECRGGGYTGLAAVAMLALLGVGVGFPLLIFLRLRHADTRVLASGPSFAPWAFLFLGYRVPPAPLAATRSLVPKAPSAASDAAVTRKTSNLRTRKTVEPEPGAPAALAAYGIAATSLAFDDVDSVAMVANPVASMRAVEPDARSDPGPSIPGGARAASGTVTATAPATGRMDCLFCCTCKWCGRGKYPLRRATTVSGKVSPAVAAVGFASMCCRRRRRCGPIIAHGNRAWWEATVLLRKLIIVLLSRLVAQSLVQISLFVTAITLFLVAHLLWHPYVESRFELTEGASLLSLTLTACLAINAQPSISLPEGVVTAVHITIVLVNVAALAFLLWSWLRLILPKRWAVITVVLQAAQQRLRRCRARPGASTPSSASSLPSSQLQQGSQRLTRVEAAMAKPLDSTAAIDAGNEPQLPQRAAISVECHVRKATGAPLQDPKAVVICAAGEFTATDATVPLKVPSRRLSAEPVAVDGGVSARNAAAVVMLADAEPVAAARIILRPMSVHLRSQIPKVQVDEI